MTPSVISSDQADLAAEPLAADALLRGRLTLLRAQLPIVLAGNVLVSSIAAWLLRDRVSHDLLGMWVSAIAIVALVRWLVDEALQRSISARVDRYRLLSFAIGSLASGLLWGSVAFWLVDPGDPYYTAMIVLMLAGMTAGAVPSLSTHAAVYACYAIPTMLPITLVLVLGEGVVIPGAGIFMALFLLVNLGYSLTLHRSYGETIRRRHENARLVERLREQMRIASEANVAKSKFLAAASHDLRQPLYALGLFLDALEPTLTEAQQQRLMGRARQSMEALQQLFNALLDISRLDAGAMEVHRAPVDLDVLLHELHAEFEPQARDKGLALRLQGQEVWVLSDEVLLRRMLRNLLSNAVRYTDQGSVSLRVSEAPGGISVAICDTGVGIDPYDQERIFQEFQQLDNPARDRRKGLGLGLAIVRRLAALLDHRLALDSTPGSGSCFTVTMPKAEPVSEISDLIDADSCHADWCGRVLLVDDEPEVLEAVAMTLEGWEMTVKTAPDIGEALALVADGFRPELLITDYRLAGGTVGLELVDTLRAELGEGLGVLLITGDTAPDELAKVHARGIPVLSKPVGAGELRRAINREMDRQALF